MSVEGVVSVFVAVKGNKTESSLELIRNDNRRRCSVI